MLWLHRLPFELLSQQCLLITALSPWMLCPVPPPSVPAAEARFSSALVAGREWRGVCGVRCLAGRPTIFKESGRREVGMWQWGWAREASVGGEAGKGDASGDRKLLRKKGWGGVSVIFEGGCWRVWKRARHSPSLFPDPLFLPYCPSPGQAASAGTFCVEAGWKDTARRGQIPETSVPAAREDGEKDEASAAGAGAPCSPGRGLWDLGAGLSSSHPSLQPIPLSPRRGEVSPAPARPGSCSFARALDQLCSQFNLEILYSELHNWIHV